MSHFRFSRPPHTFHCLRGKKWLRRSSISRIKHLSGGEELKLSKNRWGLANAVGSTLINLHVFLKGWLMRKSSHAFVTFRKHSRNRFIHAPRPGVSNVSQVILKLIFSRIEFSLPTVCFPSIKGVSNFGKHSKLTAKVFWLEAVPSPNVLQHRRPSFVSVKKPVWNAIQIVLTLTASEVCL